MTPTRLNYARDKERELHDTLVFLTNSKQGEIQQIIQQVIKDLEENLIDEACALEIPGFSTSSNRFVFDILFFSKASN